MAYSLAGKTVVVTGASLGIGREEAFKFAAEGCRLAITFFEDEKEGREAAQECRRIGAPEVLLLKLNLMDDESIRAAASEVRKKFGKVSVLVNSAGWLVWKRLDKQSFDDISRQVRTNLEGHIKFAREVLPFTQDAMISVASGAGEEGFAELSAYCATKFGVRGFVQSMAKERPDLRVYAVNPGETATRMTGFTGDPPEKVAQVILDTAKGKYGNGRGNDVDVWEHI
jgi:NAD(P)-dependent dehydrogenase (short-subunit alcohol dehydrogenase family)